MISGIIQSDAIFLWDITNSMHIYCMAYIFLVQDRIFTMDGYCCFVACCHFFCSLREERLGSLTKQSGITCLWNSCGPPIEIQWARKKEQKHSDCSNHVLVSVLNEEKTTDILKLGSWSRETIRGKRWKDKFELDLGMKTHMLLASSLSCVPRHRLRTENWP